MATPATTLASPASQEAWDAFRARDRFGSLDGLRCLSILAVIWHHGPGVNLSGFAGRGHLGVHLFFAISGFLITTLLLRERERNGSVSLRRFYARRMLRIFPLYFAVLGLYVAIASTIFPFDRSREFFSNLPFFLTYTSNWLDTNSITFGFAWSLAAEEQFYSTWPWLVSRAGLRTAAVAMAAVFGAAVWAGSSMILPIAIAGGSLVALALHTRRGFATVWRLLGWRGSPLAIAAAAILALSLPSIPNRTVHVLFVLLAAACVIREDHWGAPLLRLRPVGYIGVISYGLYMLHGLVISGLGETPFSQLSHSVSGFLPVCALSIAFASLSYRYFEGPFLRWKTRFETKRSPGAALS